MFRRIVMHLFIHQAKFQGQQLHCENPVHGAFHHTQIPSDLHLVLIQVNKEDALIEMESIQGDNAFSLAFFQNIFQEGSGQHNISNAACTRESQANECRLEFAKRTSAMSLTWSRRLIPGKETGLEP